MKQLEKATAKYTTAIGNVPNPTKQHDVVSRVMVTPRSCVLCKDNFRRTVFVVCVMIQEY